jgi:transcriptional regulator with XRE-family HTH domain
MDARSLVARNLRRLRVAQGVSQEALAVDAAVDRSYVSRVERGSVSATIDVLQRLVQALDAEMVELFVIPRPGERQPQPLRGGRRKRS